MVYLNANKQTLSCSKTKGFNSNNPTKKLPASIYSNSGTSMPARSATDPSLSSLSQDIKTNPDQAITKEMNLMGSSTGQGGTSYTGASPDASPTTNFVKDVVEKGRISTMYD